MTAYQNTVKWILEGNGIITKDLENMMCIYDQFIARVSGYTLDKIRVPFIAGTNICVVKEN